MDGTPSRAYVAFGGGGAKGLVHIGALSALEDSKLELLGFSGTSIGAVIAALKAAGYSADEMVNPRTGHSLFPLITEINPKVRKMTDLFGRWRWPQVWLLRLALKQPWLIGLVALLFVLTQVAFGYALAKFTSRLPLVVTCGFVAELPFLAIAVSALNGLGSLRRFRKILDRLLRDRLFRDEPRRRVYMRDFNGQDARPLLKIVAANLRTGRLQLFSADSTPCVRVSDAVAASIGLPVVFRMPRINLSFQPQEKGALFADGGIVSNLPAWPFDEERELDPDAITIAVELPDSGLSSRRDPGRLSWPAALARTGFFGGGELDLRAANALIRIALPSDVGLLDFDMSRDKVLQTVGDARAATELQLNSSFRDPKFYLEACRRLHDLTSVALKSSPLVIPEGIDRLRVAIARRDLGHTKSLRIWLGVGFEDGPDQSLLLPMGTVAGRAWETASRPIARPRTMAPPSRVTRTGAGAAPAEEICAGSSAFPYLFKMMYVSWSVSTGISRLARPTRRNRSSTNWLLP